MSTIKINDTVYFASFEMRKKYIECPDCFGTKHLRVILANGEEHNIECSGCAAGYEPPCGRVVRYEYEARVEEKVVTGMEIRDGVTRYYSDNSILEQQDTFTTKAEAQQRAEQKAKEWQDEMNRRISMKEKDTRTWAWNVHYHRSCIRRAEKDLAYHKEKLNSALPKLKEEKTA